MQPYFIVLNLVLAAFAVLLLILTFYKILRVHQNSFAVLAHASAIREEVESLFSQLQSLTQLDRTLAMPQGLPPMRGWAGSPDFLLHAARHVLAKQPAIAVECGSGVSTVVLARCMQLVGRGRVYSLEHESVYAGKTRALLQEYGLEDWAEVIDAPLGNVPGSTPWYDDSKCPTAMRGIDLLVVDGPPDHIAPMARYPALPRLLPRMAEHFTVMVDDAARVDETQMVARWLQEIPGLQSNTVTAEKGLAVVWR